MGYKTGFLKFIALAFFATALMLPGGCASLPKNINRTVSYALENTGSTRLGKIFEDDKAAHPGKSGFVLLGDGLDAFVARYVLAETAQKSIDAQYYLFHDDLTGKLFADMLIRAADRGVRVRLLVDDMALGGRDLVIATMNYHPNIEIRIFNPFSRNAARAPQFITRLGSVTRRMHNKSFTVDNQATILGGRNIGNEYFEADPDMAFADLDVLAVGPVVKQVSGSFDKYWSNELAYPVSTLIKERPTIPEMEAARQKFDEYIAGQNDSPYLQALKDSDLARSLEQGNTKFYWGEAEVVYDLPEKLLHSTEETKYHLSPKLWPYFEKTTKELIIFSPYFVPGAEGAAFLKELTARGVRVRVLTNSLSSTDVGLVHAGYAKYRKRLLAAGVELYEMNKGKNKNKPADKSSWHGSSSASLHAKSFLFDREMVFIGSLNLDPRSVAENTEIGVVLESAEMASGMAEWFDGSIEKLAFRLELIDAGKASEQILWHGLVDGQEKTFESEPFSSIWRQLGLSILSLLPIESQL